MGRLRCFARWENSLLFAGVNAGCLGGRGGWDLRYGVWVGGFGAPATNCVDFSTDGGCLGEGEEWIGGD